MAENFNKSRFQKLAGIKYTNDSLLEDYLLETLIKNHFYSNNLVLEGQLDEGKLKDFIKGVKDNFKKKQQPKLNNLLSALKKFGKPASAIAFFNTLNNLGINLKDKKELAIVASILRKKSLKEAEGDVVEKDGKKFIETINPFNGDVLLVPEEDYVRVEDQLGGPSIIGKLSKFFNNTFMGKVAKGILVAGPLFAGIADEVGDFAQEAGDIVGLDISLGGEDAPSSETIRGLMKAGFSAEEIQDYLDSKFAVDVGGQEGGVVDDIEPVGDNIDVDPGDLASDTGDISDADDQGLNIKTSGDETVNFTKFSNGSSQLDSEALQKISSENSTIVDYLQNGQDYSETVLGVSSNTGANSNVDNNGGDLNQNRATNTADAILNDLESQLKDQNIEYSRTGNTIELADGGTYTLDTAGVNDPGDLKQIDNTNDTATQSAIRVGEPGDEPPSPTRLFGFDPVRPEKTPPAKPSSPKSEPSPKPPPPIPPGVATKVAKLPNRITIYAKHIVPAITGESLYQLLGVDKSYDVTNGMLTKIVKSGDGALTSAKFNPDKEADLKTWLEKNGKLGDKTDSVLNNIKNNFSKVNSVSRYIQHLAKNPEVIRDFLNQNYKGLDLEPRAKAISTLQEHLNLLIEGTPEDFGLATVSKDQLNKNFPALLGIVSSIYSNQKGQGLGYSKTFRDNNSNLFKGGLKGYERKVGDYFVMDLEKTNPSGGTTSGTERGKGKFAAGIGKAYDKEEKPTEPDVAKSQKALQSNTNLLAKLKLICDKEELANLILAIIVYTNPGFEKNKSTVKSALFSLRNRYKNPKDVKEDINPSPTLKTTSSDLAGYVAYGAGSDYKMGVGDEPGKFLSKTIKDPKQLKQLQQKTADIKKVTDILDNYGGLKNKLKTINTKEEFDQLILRVILPNVCKQLKNNPGAIKGALIAAANKYNDTLNEIKNIIYESNILSEVKGKDKEYLTYAIATNLAKYGTPRTPKGAKKTKVYKPTIKKRDKIAKELLKKLEEYFIMQEARTQKGKKVPQKYLKGLKGKGTYGSKEAMKKEIDKFAGKNTYKKDWYADYTDTGKRVKTKKSAATKAYEKMYGESVKEQILEILQEATRITKALKNKSEKSGIPVSILRQVYNKGKAAWNTGHRPGSTQDQWAMGRVNSFITGSGGARKADAKLWAKAKKTKSKKK